MGIVRIPVSESVDVSTRQTIAQDVANCLVENGLTEHQVEVYVDEP